MALRTFNDTTDDHKWSTAGNWDTAPTTEVDHITIAAGKTCLFDVTTYTVTGGALTISSGATLQCPDDLASHTLTLAGGNITGAGTLKAGTSTSSRLSQATTFIINVGAYTIDGSGGLIVALYCAEPTNAYVKLSENEASGQTELSVDTNVTAQAAWAADAPLVICDVDKALDYQGVADDPRTLVSTAASTITISAGGLDSDNIAGAYIVLATRNIEVRVNGNYYAFTSVTGGNMYCSIRQVGATQVGRGLSSCTNCNVGGVVSGLERAIYIGSGHTISGTVTGNYYGIIYGSGHTISGTVTGNGYGIHSGSGHTISGTVTGNTIGIIYGGGHTISGTVTGNGYGIYSGSGHTINGTVTGNTIGIIYGGGHTINGTVTGNDYGIYVSSINLARGCVFGTNTRDVYNVSGESYSTVYGNGAALGSTEQVDAWKRTSVTVSRYDIGTFLYDVPATSGGTPQVGQVKAWMPGGRVVSGSVTGTPPITLTYSHAFYAEDSIAPVFFDWPIAVVNGKPIAITWYLNAAELADDYSVAPRLELIDPDYTFGHASSILTYSEYVLDGPGQGAWGTVGTLQYTPTVSRNLIVRFRAVSDSATTRSGQFFWQLLPSPLLPEVDWLGS